MRVCGGHAGWLLAPDRVPFANALQEYDCTAYLGQASQCIADEAKLVEHCMYGNAIGGGHFHVFLSFSARPQTHAVVCTILSSDADWCL